MLNKFLIAACLALTCLAAFPLPAETIELLPVKDNTLFEDAGGRFSNGGGKHLFMGRVGPDGGNLLRRTLVAFDLSGIPENALINNVQLEFAIVQVPQDGVDGTPAADSATLHVLDSDWGEGFSNAPGNEGQGVLVEPVDPELPIDIGAVTWVHRFFDPDPMAAILWNTPGGDFQSLPSASAPFGVSPETLTFSSTPELLADVKYWVTHPESNYGWMLRGDEIRPQNARGVASREHASEPVPKLVVDYTIPSVTDFLELSEATSALSNPVGVAHAGDHSGRLFIVEQEGVIRIYDTVTNTLLPTPFLDIQDEVFSLQDTNGGNEQGLLGLAFHPGYAGNGRFFVNYTTSPAQGVWHTVVAEYGVSLDENLALESGEVILEFEQEARNHNGGDIHFGPDGSLYIASGDGGGSNNQYGNAQNIDTLRGALLRIDVDTLAPEGSELCSLAGAYGIPPGNAFPGASDGCDEILHIGLRNPWRFSFDAQTGDLLIADVGQGDWEEINHVPGNASGLNFGWPCREGMHDFDLQETCTPPLTEPVLEYGHVDGNCSVTGGYVYHGNQLPLNGSYLYGDWCSQRVWIGSPSGGSWSAEEWQGTAAVLNSLSSFGQDENCELYVTDRAAGALYRIDDGEIVFRNGLESSKCQ
jgi:glucose/arabinose dehydrogenase